MITALTRSKEDAEIRSPDEGDEDLARLRRLAEAADRNDGVSLRGLTRVERRKVMLGL